MTRVPKKLKNDSIVDAICELRFDCKELREAPELVVGFLASNSAWRGFERQKLPAADIPEQIRTTDPNLQNQPT